MIDSEGYARKSALLRGYAAAHGMAVLLANYAEPQGAGGSALWAHDVTVAGAGETLLVQAIAR